MLGCFQVKELIQNMIDNRKEEATRELNQYIYIYIYIYMHLCRRHRVLGFGVRGILYTGISLCYISL